jgi:hypothetical protein
MRISVVLTPLHIRESEYEENLSAACYMPNGLLEKQ